MNIQNRWRTACAAVVAAFMVAVGINLLPAQSIPRAVTASPGGHTFCLVNSSGFCTVTHNLGGQPAGVVVTSDRIGQLGTTDQFTPTTFRVRWWWHNGSLFATGTRIDFSWVPAGVPDPVPPTTTPPTSATPTTTPTTVSPTPTPTPTVTPTEPGPSPVKACTSPSFTTTAGPGNYNGASREWADRDFPDRKYITHNDMWNNDNGTYTMNACSYDNWYELATQPNTTDGSVKTYPKSSRNYCAGWELSYCGDFSPTTSDRQMPLDRVESVRFAHNTTKVTGMIWNVAFDIWINNALENELMIWTENHGQRPAGSMVDSSHFIGGKEYQVWKAGSGAGGIFTYVSVVTQTHGTMPVGLFFDDLQARGWLRPKSGQVLDTTWQVNYGVEIVDTNNTQHRFNFTDFAINQR